MKRADLIKIVEGYLEDFGFSRGTWLWLPRSSELYVILGGAIKAIKLRASMTKRALIFEMGRLAGLAEAAGIIAPEKPKSAAQKKRTSNGIYHAPASQLVMGMPA